MNTPDAQAHAQVITHVGPAAPAPGRIIHFVITGSVVQAEPLVGIVLQSSAAGIVARALSPFNPASDMNIHLAAQPDVIAPIYPTAYWRWPPRT